MKKFVYILLFFLFIPLYVKADTIDLNKQGSLNVVYKYSDVVLSNSKVYIYKIANYDSNLEFKYLDDFKLEDSLNNDSSSEWNELAIKIKKYISDNKINYLKTCTINDNGNCKIDNLDSGLYLVTADNYLDEEYEYSSSPSLIAVPNYNKIDDTYIYKIDMILKTDAKKVKVDTNINNDKKNNDKILPKTVDNIYLYVGMCVISLLIIVLVLVLSKRKKL